jgi:hypothetical protein
MVIGVIDDSAQDLPAITACGFNQQGNFSLVVDGHGCCS